MGGEELGEMDGEQRGEVVVVENGVKRLLVRRLLSEWVQRQCRRAMRCRA